MPFNNPSIQLKRVVLPAPLGPITPNKSPSLTLNEILSSTLEEKDVEVTR
jgi:hypothetical protein